MREDFKIINKKIEEDRKVIDNLLTLFAHANEEYANCDVLARYVDVSLVDALREAQKKLEEGFLNEISSIDLAKDIAEFRIAILDEVYVHIRLNIHRNRVSAMPGYQSLAFKYNGITYSTTLDVLIAVFEDISKK